jgi:diguanylate cyclase (GGDEF)-like protein/PAS domain S-box-containing protein
MKLSYKLIVPILTGYIAIGSLVHFLWMPKLLSDDQQYFIVSQNDIVKSIIPEINRSLLSGDLATLHMFLDTQMQLHKQSWGQLQVKDSAGLLIYPFEEISFSVNKNTTEISIALRYLEEELGTVFVLTDWSKKKLSIETELNLLEFYILFIFGVIIITGIIWQNYQIIKPLLGLTQAITELTKGRSSLDHLKVSNDEIGQLTHAFQQMIKVRHKNEEMLATKQLETEEALKNLTKQQSALDQHAIVSITNLKGVITFANTKFSQISGYGNEELVGEDHRIVNSGHHDSQFFSEMYHTISKGNVWHNEVFNKAKNGDAYCVDTTIIPFLDNDGKPKSYISISTDITERKIAEEKIKLAASVFTHARESIAITDTTGAIIDVNDTFITTTGYSRQEAIGQNSRILKSGRQLPEFYADMWRALLKEGYWSGELWNRRKSGEVYAEIKTISAVRDEHGITTHYVSLGNDITPIKEHQAQLERIAHFDLLTNLPNRVLLSDRLSQAILQCSRHAKSLAVVFLDLDGFKTVNDAHGHDMGDELLIALSVRMKKALRQGDTLSRIGGDEFVAVLADLVNVEDYVPILDRLLLAASEPVTVGDIALNVSASIGVTLYPQDNVDADQLMRHADQAMYAAKESGKNRYHLFDIAQDDAVKVQRESLEAIRSALDNHQFVLYYQPKVNMRTGSVIGAEALIRWQHPKRGLLNPLEFLPVIENNHMMIEMGEWVIDSALTQISQWQAMGLNLPLKISVNIAAVQLKQPDFTQRLITLLAAHPNVEPHYLELEVLETSAFEDVHHITTTMNDCMALGVNFSLDDFGTGYSSLTYLRRLPANVIKIDQTFVRDMLIDPDDFAIVEGVIALAKSFKRDVVAEGVETIEHGSALLQLGCELAQGYGIARPMPASDIPAWIREWKPDVSWGFVPIPSTLT